MKVVPPSVEATAFSCPHCGTLTTQTWYSVHADRRKGESTAPSVWRTADVEKLKLTEEPNDIQLKKFLLQAAGGAPFLYDGHGYTTCGHHAINLHISRCFECSEYAVWIFDRLVYPLGGEAPPANSDLPAHIRRDYNEASAILNLSPRGAAALLRLSLQHLCKELGEAGKNINDDIAALVAKGLDIRLQQALDAVRVVGNNAVHPGQIDLKDDRATALSLFRLLNVIAEKLISEPKHIQGVFDSLPEEARKAIEARDKKRP